MWYVVALSLMVFIRNLELSHGEAMKNWSWLFVLACAGALGACSKDGQAGADAGQVAGAPEQGQKPVATQSQMVTTCNIETVGGNPIGKEILSVDGSQVARITGWVIDSQSASVPTDIELRLVAPDGSAARGQKIERWRDRPDVVAAHGGNAGYLHSGFTLDLDLKGLSGPHSMQLAFGGKACDVGRSVVIVSN